MKCPCRAMLRPMAISKPGGGRTNAIHVEGDRDGRTSDVAGSALLFLGTVAAAVTPFTIPSSSQFLSLLL